MVGAMHQIHGPQFVTRDAAAGRPDWQGAARRARATDHEITVFKNGGGAHLDLMVASWIIDNLSQR